MTSKYMWTQSWTANQRVTNTWMTLKLEGVLSVHDRLLLWGTTFIILFTMREVLDKIHEGHQEVVKCRERASQRVWWPGLSNRIEELVLNCRIDQGEGTCERDTQQNVQKDPARSRVTATTCWWLTILRDMYKVYRCDSTLEMFAQHGPRFSGHDLKALATHNGFEQVTSSPKLTE